jgi:O-antigen/teichoic acid export membrane protein
MIGGLLSQGVKFLVVIYIARSFPPHQFGWLSFAIAVNAFLFIVGHFGLPTYGARTVARAGTVHADVVLSICAARGLLSLISTGVTCVILRLVTSVSREELLLVTIFGLSNVPVAGLLDWAFQGIHRQDVSAIINVVWQVLWFAFVVFGVRKGAGVLVVPVSLCISALLAAVLAYVWLARNPGIEHASAGRLNLYERSRRMLISGAALGTGTLLITVLVWSDTIVVRLLRGDQAAGLYAAGNRAALALAMLANYFMQGGFPLLSRVAGDTTQFNACFQQCYDDLAFVFVPASLWAIVYAREIVGILFHRPEYATATIVFQIFQVVLLATIFENLYGIGALVAHRRDADYQRSLMLTTALFIPLCVVSVRVAGIMGGAVAAFLAQAFCAALFVRKSKDLVVVDHRRALLIPASLGLSVAAISKGLDLTLYWSLPALLLAYGALAVTRLRSRNCHVGVC